MPNEPAINKFLRDMGVEPTECRKENLKLARPFFRTYKQNKERQEQASGR